MCWKLPEPLYSFSVPRDKKINRGPITIQRNEGIWQTDGEGTSAVLNYRLDTVGYTRIHVPIDFIDALEKSKMTGPTMVGKGRTGYTLRGALRHPVVFVEGEESINWLRYTTLPGIYLVAWKVGPYGANWGRSPTTLRCSLDNDLWATFMKGETLQCDVQMMHSAVAARGAIGYR